MKILNNQYALPDEHSEFRHPLLETPKLTKHFAPGIPCMGPNTAFDLIEQNHHFPISAPFSTILHPDLLPYSITNLEIIYVRPLTITASLEVAIDSGC